MKRKLFGIAGAAAVLSALMVLAGCDTNAGNGSGGDPKESGYEGFYNYPAGRTNGNGTLTIQNNAASPVLLFTSDVAPENYIGTVGSTSSIKVKLPEEKFYTIVAVEKANWEEKGEQAAQYSEISYYSNTQGYSVTVSPNSMYGAGQWIINNYTSYWVALRKADLSSENYAVVAPSAKRVIVPIQIGTNYDYVPHYFKELKYDGKVIALVESDDQAASDTVVTTQGRTSFTTNLGQGTIQPPSTDLKPAIYFSNYSDKTVRVYIGAQNQLSAIGVSGTDFALASGDTQMFTDGIAEGTSTNTINFNSTAWNPNKYVTQDMTMRKNKVYRIVLNKSGETYSTTCEEQEASAHQNKIADIAARGASQYLTNLSYYNRNAETHLYLVYHLFGAAEFPYRYDFINIVNIASETPVPILNDLTAEEKNRVLANDVYIIVQNTSTFSLVLISGANEILPLGSSSSVLASGNTGVYRVNAGGASSYQFKQNGISTIAFPSGLSAFSNGTLYALSYSGSSLAWALGSYSSSVFTVSVDGALRYQR